MRVAEIPIFLRPRPAAAPSGAVRVQTSGVKGFANTSNASDTLNAAGNFTAGNTVIIAMTTFNDASPSTPFSSVTVSGTSAVEDTGRTHADNINYRTAIWRATNVTGGSSAVVLTWTGGGGAPVHYISCSFEEWSGFLASPLDAVPTAVQSTGTSTSISSGALAQASEIVYASTSTTNSNSTGLSGPSSGFTQTNLDTGATFLANASGYKAVSSTASVTATFGTSGSVETDTVMATYKTS